MSEWVFILQCERCGKKMRWLTVADAGMTKLLIERCDGCDRGLKATSVARPQDDTRWVTAKRESPSRVPYSDEELQELRITYAPGAPYVVNAEEATAIWTLLDMIEKERGWAEWA